MRLSNGEVRLKDLPAGPTRWSVLCRLLVMNNDEVIP